MRAKSKGKLHANSTTHADEVRKPQIQSNAEPTKTGKKGEETQEKSKVQPKPKALLLQGWESPVPLGRNLTRRLENMGEKNDTPGKEGELEKSKLMRVNPVYYGRG